VGLIFNFHSEHRRVSVSLAFVLSISQRSAASALLLLDVD